MLDHSDTLESLRIRVWAILPALYQDRYEDVQPVSMGSAALQYGPDGLVAWDQIWGSFCDLAMAGGPPHKGKLLEPASSADIAANQTAYQGVTDEICRAIQLVTGLSSRASLLPGWIEVQCEDLTMAEWLMRAIVMENISAFARSSILFLPAGPHYRLAKETKNVVTAIAKTTHYWTDHIWPAQRYMIASLFHALSEQAPLLQPPLDLDAGDSAWVDQVGARLLALTGWRSSPRVYAGWMGLECGRVDLAVWMMRSLVASNMLARREETTLFVPVDTQSDPLGSLTVSLVNRVYLLSRESGIGC